MLQATAIVLVLTFLSAGCITVPESDARVQSVTGAGPRTLHLDPDGKMGDPLVVTSIVPLSWGWRSWASGVEASAWYSAPAADGYVVANATATVLYQALKPTSSAQARPEFTVWFGVEDSIVDHGFAEGPDRMLQGERASAEFELRLPRGGLVVQPGERLVLRIGSYYGDDSAQDAIAAVFGADEATRLDLVLEPYTHIAVRETKTFDGRVQLVGGRCLGLDPASDQDMAWVPFTLPESPRPLVGIDIVIDWYSGSGVRDIDFVLLDEKGDVAAHGAGSAGHEAARLRSPNLPPDIAAGTWQLGVYACTPMVATAAWSIGLLYG